MQRLALALLLVACAAAVALVLRKRRGDAPSTPPATVPTQIDRSDFDRADFNEADVAWLVVVFTSATCLSCLSVWHRIRSLESPDVGVAQAEVSARPDLHRRYGIDSVPLTVAVDDAGIVRASVLGPVADTDLATLTDLVSTGSS